MGTKIGELFWDESTSAPKKSEDSSTTNQPNTTPIKDILEAELEDILGQNYVDEYSGGDKHIGVDEIAQKLDQAIQTYIDNKIVEVLEKAHRANNAHDYDNETDEYIDELIATIKSNQSKGNDDE